MNLKIYNHKILKVMNNKIFKAGSWYTITNFLVKGISFLSIPIFTRLLSTSEFGMVSLYAAWLSIFTVLIGFGLNESIRRAKYDYSEELFNEFISSVLFLSVIIFSLYFLIFLLFIEFFLTVTGIGSILFYFMIFQAFFTNVYNIAITKYRLEYRYKFTSILTIFVTLSGLMLSIYFISNTFTENKFVGRIIGDGLLLIGAGLIFLLIFLNKGKRLISIGYWRYSLILGFPLIFHGLGLIANAQIDRIVINHFWGSSVTGIYSFAYQVGMISLIIAIGLDQAWNPWFFEKYKANAFNIIREKAKVLRNSYTVIYATILFLTPELVELMATKSYWEGQYIIPWIFMAHYFVFMYTLEINVEYASKRTKIIAAATIISAVINLGLNVLLVPKYGYVAAVITTVVSYYLLFLLHYFITAKIIKIKIFGFKFHLISTLYVLGITLFYYIFQDSLIIRLTGIIILWVLIYRLITNNNN